MPNAIETIANFPDLVSAEMARSALAAEGIEALIPDQNLAGLDWRLGTAIGGVRLQVAPEDADSARRILEEMAKGHPDDGDDWREDRSAEARSDAPELRCPACGAGDIHPAPQRKRLKGATMLFFPLLLLWPLLALFTPRHACRTCGHVWG